MVEGDPDVCGEETRVGKEERKRGKMRGHNLCISVKYVYIEFKPFFKTFFSFSFYRPQITDLLK